MIYDKLKTTKDRANSVLGLSDRLTGVFARLKELSDKIELTQGLLKIIIEGHLPLMERRLEFIQESLGRIESRQLGFVPGHQLHASEFRAFSQWGEDGIIQFLIKNVDIEHKTFVEFGSDHYHIESNTRFLLTNNNWSGLVIDGDAGNIERLKASPTYWLYNLQAVQSFVTKDNINRIIEENGFAGEIGLLSIDIDGNDYWVWQAIDVVSPVILVIEYNHRFGSKLAVTTPYDEKFNRFEFHPSKIVYGASLKALCLLAEQKGYSFIGCNSNGVNAFFIRKDKRPAALKELTVEEGFVPGRFSEMQVKDGRLVKTPPEDEARFVQSLSVPLVDVEGFGAR